MIPLWLGLALMGGSAVANTIGARQQQSAVNDATSAERRRQRGFDEEAYATNEEARGRFENIDQQQGQKVEDLQSLYADMPRTSLAGMLPPTSSVVSQHQDKATAEADEFGAQQAGARARLNSFGDLLGDISIGQSRDAGHLGMLGSLRRGSQAVLPAELDAAQQRGGGMRFLGDLLGGAGQVATMGALTGARMPSLGGLFGGSRMPQAAARNVSLMGLY